MEGLEFTLPVLREWPLGTLEVQFLTLGCSLITCHVIKRRRGLTVIDNLKTFTIVRIVLISHEILNLTFRRVLSRCHDLNPSLSEHWQAKEIDFVSAWLIWHEETLQNSSQEPLLTSQLREVVQLS